MVSITSFLYINQTPVHFSTSMFKLHCLFFIILQCVQLLQFVNIFHKSIWINYYITNFNLSPSIWSDNSAVVQSGKLVAIKKTIRNTCQDAPFQPQGQFNTITSRYLNCTIFHKNSLFTLKTNENFLIRDMYMTINDWL